MSFSNIGIKIKLAREAAKLSQGALSKRSGIAQSTLSYIEKGVKSPTMDTVAAICDGLNISMLELLVFGEQNKSNVLVKNNKQRKKVRLEKSLDKEFENFKDYIVQKYGK